MTFKRKKEYGLEDNKSFEIKQIYGIEIENFRLFHNQNMNLGKNITVVSGRNGTMKSTLMGLIAQPFRTSSENLYGAPMQTTFGEVFNLSLDKDSEDYIYHIKMLINDNLELKEPIPLYLQKETPTLKARHRLVPSGRNKGDGYFTLPSVYINLKRLYPLIDTDSIESYSVDYSPQEMNFISKFYESILLRTEFNNFSKYEAVKGKLQKMPIGPVDAPYDINTISSGEDNLSTFADILISFNRIFEENKQNNKDVLTGILSIDEFEASLHPIAQLNLFNYLLSWSQKYKVQIILNTHSLYLIQKVLEMTDYIKHDHVKVNFITTGYLPDNQLGILENPPYSTAYSELTLSDVEEKATLLKVKILCEDDLAEKYIKKIIKSKKILNHCEFSFIVDDFENGTSKTLLKTLCKNFPKILTETKAMVIFDGDVTEQMNFRNFSNYLVIPSADGVPLEREIIRYIITRPRDDDFFARNRKTKESYHQSFAQTGIPLGSDNTTNIKPYKDWVKNNQNEFNKYVTYYISKHPDLYKDFHVNFLNIVNSILEQNSLPTIS